MLRKYKSIFILHQRENGDELNSVLGKKTLAVVGFEPTPPKRLEPKSSALDRSATLPIRLPFLVYTNYLHDSISSLNCALKPRFKGFLFSFPNRWLGARVSGLNEQSPEGGPQPCWPHPRESCLQADLFLYRSLSSVSPAAADTVCTAWKPWWPVAAGGNDRGALPYGLLQTE